MNSQNRITIPHEQRIFYNVSAVFSQLQTLSVSFSQFVIEHRFNSYTELFNFFVNVDAYKDNKHAFTTGSNQFFTSPHNSIRGLPGQKDEFKKKMRSIMENLTERQLCYLLHVHKLKYRSNGKLPPPDILKYLDSRDIYACYDSGSGTDKIFGSHDMHSEHKDVEILCSVANTVIDPGPSGSNCDVHVITPPLVITGNFFNHFGYKNIINFITGNVNQFELNLRKSDNTQQTITHHDSDSKYYKGNNENKQFFQASSNKNECDIRTTLKKLGDDLQVFITCMYKNFLIASGNTTILCMMLTCDLGVSFNSLMLGVDCVFKDKDEEQRQPNQNKMGNSWYIKSLLAAPPVDFTKEFEKIRAYVQGEYNDFLSIIQEILDRFNDINHNIFIQIKGDTLYNKQQMINTIGFFKQMDADLQSIHDFIESMPVEQNSTAIAALKKCVPNKFILRTTIADTYVFMLAQKYTRGELVTNVKPLLNNGRNIGKAPSTPFVQHFKTMVLQTSHTRGGADPIKMNNYFITDKIMKINDDGRDGGESIIERRHFFDVVKKNFQRRSHYIKTKMNRIRSLIKKILEYGKKNITKQSISLTNRSASIEIDENKKDFINDFIMRSTIIYGETDLYYNCLSYIDDALYGFADYEKIPKYVDEYVEMIHRWLNEEIETIKRVFKIMSTMDKKLKPNITRKPGRLPNYLHTSFYTQLGNLYSTMGSQNTTNRISRMSFDGGKSKRNNNTRKKRKTRKNELSK